MEFKHSPAPWYLRGGVIKNSLLIDDNHNVVASFLTEIKEEDAHLIAAAPELLESLRELVSAMVRYEIDAGESAPVKHENMMNKARAAIAKALGQQ
ncbi:hypothetical protein GWI96_11040 [Proteus sp. G4380]|uniref:hypothetical protein n=1 Tax=Proteus sp. G4380 TaxID=2698851 RepID=UPI00192A0D84|nr:hypothetical protein [Proteus sp. G4380]NBN53347.1 hypothetical protein [Proteus sp. G4380]